MSLELSPQIIPIVAVKHETSAQLLDNYLSSLNLVLEEDRSFGRARLQTSSALSAGAAFFDTSVKSLRKFS